MRSLVTALVLSSALVFTALPAHAQVSTIIPRQTRSTAVSSGNGNSLARGSSGLFIRLDSPSWASQTGTIHALVEISTDNGQTWRYSTEADWQGGQMGKDGLPPGMYFNETDFNDKRYRVTLTPSQSMNFGMTADIT